MDNNGFKNDPAQPESNNSVNPNNVPPSQFPAPSPSPTSSPSDDQLVIDNPSVASTITHGSGPRSKKPLIIALIVILLVLVAAGVAYYFLVINKPVEQAVATKPTETTKVVMDAESIINGIKPKLKADPVTITSVVDGHGMAGSVMAYPMASFQPKGRAFLTQAEKGSGVAVSTAEANSKGIDADYEAMVTYLEDNKFTTEKKVVAPQPSINVQYESDDVVCYITVQYKTAGKNYAGIGCANVSEYEKTAELAQPLYDAYMIANPKYAATASDSPAYFGIPVFSNGVSGYKKATVQLIGTQGLFYLIPNETVWKFFKESQVTLRCSEFNTADLKKAFNGTTCVDVAGKTSKVSA